MNIREFILILVAGFVLFRVFRSLSGGVKVYNFNNFPNQQPNRQDRKKEGEITIENIGKTNTPKSKSASDGDYVDYEEIK